MESKERKCKAEKEYKESINWNCQSVRDFQESLLQIQSEMCIILSCYMKKIN